MATSNRSMQRLLRLYRHLRIGLRLVWIAAPRLLTVLVALQLLLGLTAVVAVIVGGRLAERIIQIPASGSPDITAPIVAFLGLTFTGLVVSAVKSEYQRVLAEATERHATDVVLRSLVAAELAHFESPRFHDLALRALGNAGSRSLQLVHALLGLVSSSVAILGLGIMMLALAPRLLLIILVGVVPLWWLSRRATRARYEFEVSQTERDRRRHYFLTGLASRSEAAELRVYGAGHGLRRRIADLHHQRIRELVRLARFRSLVGVAGAGVTVAVGGLVLVGLIALFDDSTVDIERVTLVTVAFLVLSERLGTITNAGSSVLECALFLGDVERFEAESSGSVDNDTALSDEPIDHLALAGVSFRYPSSGVTVLTEIDLELERGQLVAIVGPNGSGKTTLARLVTLLYEPTKGVVRINGLDHRPADSLARRLRVALVPQDYLHLLMTASENVALGDLDALDDRARLNASSALAGATEMVSALPSGWDTLLGTEFSGGHELSGGQWQRLAIARAAFREADVLVLDEPTSALDPEAEVALVKRLKALAADRIVVLISHRFGTVSQADRIVVLEGGAMVEDGTHDTLMRRGGVYASLYDVQARSFR